MIKIVKDEGCITQKERKLWTDSIFKQMLEVHFDSNFCKQGGIKISSSWSLMLDSLQDEKGSKSSLIKTCQSNIDSWS